MYKSKNQARITNTSQSKQFLDSLYHSILYTHESLSLCWQYYINIQQITIIYWLISYYCYHQRQVLFFSITIHHILHHYHKYSNRITIHHILHHYHLYPICYLLSLVSACCNKMEIQRIIIIINNNNFTFLIRNDIKPIHSWLLNIFIQFFYNHLALH